MSGQTGHGLKRLALRRLRARLRPSHLERRLATTPGRTSSQLTGVLCTRVVSRELTARVGALQSALWTWRV